LAVDALDEETEAVRVAKDGARDGRVATLEPEDADLRIEFACNKADDLGLESGTLREDLVRAAGGQSLRRV
jgi:hypothetical protein